MRYLLTNGSELSDFSAPTLRQAEAPIVAPPPAKPTQVKVFPQTDPQAESIRLAAAAKPVPPPDLPQLDDPVPQRSDAADSWGIQIGSFSRQSNAHIAARDARHTAHDILNQTCTCATDHVWRCCLLGSVSRFKENEARQACVELHQTGMACIAVPGPRV